MDTLRRYVAVVTPGNIKIVSGVHGPYICADFPFDTSSGFRLVNSVIVKDDKVYFVTASNGRYQLEENPKEALASISHCVHELSMKKDGRFDPHYYCGCKGSKTASELLDCYSARIDQSLTSSSGYQYCTERLQEANAKQAFFIQGSLAVLNKNNVVQLYTDGKKTGRYFSSVMGDDIIYMLCKNVTMLLVTIFGSVIVCEVDEGKINPRIVMKMQTTPVKEIVVTIDTVHKLHEDGNYTAINIFNNKMVMMKDVLTIGGHKV